MSAAIKDLNIPNLKDPLASSIWRALTTAHCGLGETRGQARRYPAAMAPFAAVKANTEAAMADLRELLSLGETVFLMGERPVEVAGLRSAGIVPCLQMLLPGDLPVPSEAAGGIAVVGLDCANTDEMQELIAVAFPGYFRAQTCRMGDYFGIREGGRLIAMGGERLVLESGGTVWREISGLCSHPEQAGRGLGTVLLLHLLRRHREAGAVSWLHVVETNHRAIELYHRLGFVTLRRVELHRLVREG